MAQIVVPVDCHLMPCVIDHNGASSVTSFFTPKCHLSNDGRNKAITASFRGRLLQGKEVCLPTGYTGVILKEKKESSSENKTSQLHATNMFEKLTVWNWDKTPTANDKLVSMMDWFDISKQIHGEYEDHQDSTSTKIK